MKRKKARLPVKIWMLEQGIKGIDIADKADIDPTYVYHFLAGRRRGGPVADALKKMGCPEDLLTIPEERAA